jgi:hypothetical protein
VAQSPFVSGEWLKIAVTETGVHRINGGDIARLNINGENSRNFRLFGFTQRQLPQPNNAEKGELREVSTEISDTDGQFAGNDYLLFYAEGPNTVSVTDSLTFTHQTHAYSDTAFYFLSISGNIIGKRIQRVNPVSNGNAISVNSYDDAYVWENEAVNLENSGRQWFGQFFNTKIDFDLPIKGIIPNSKLRIESSLLGTLRTNEEVELSVGDNPFGTHKLQSTRYDARDPFFRYARRGIIDNQSFTTNYSGTGSKLTYQFKNSIASPSGGYVDYFLVHSKRALRFYEKQTTIRSFESVKNEVTRFSVQGYSTNERIWEITDLFEINAIEPAVVGTQATFNSTTRNQLRTFQLFTTENTLSPTNIQRLENQQLVSSEIPNLFIISPKAFLQEANRLADFRRINDKLSVEVISVEHIYNEYSGGMVDPTALRNFIRETWKQSPENFKYVLFFGDATFDYKNKLNLAENGGKNSIPTYESRESLEPVYSHSSDDYFGFLEENEGNWGEGIVRFGNLDDRTAEDHTLDIGVGRLPVRNATQAKQVVNKLIYYDTSPHRFGSWRTQLSFLADDEDAGFDYNIHLKDADRLSRIATNATSTFYVNKMYLGAFPQTSTPNGNRSPEARRALDEAVQKGSLIVNYNGHGSEDGWTDEKVLTIEQLLRWRNLNNLPLMLTATCEFGRYDSPGVVSGAELAVLNPRGGAIGLLTTTRPVYSTTNFLLNSAFFEALKSTKENPRLGDPRLDGPRLGDIFRLTKNASISGMANRNFVLLGDPSMRLALPQDKIKLLKINGSPPESQQIKALQRVTLTGEVEDDSFDGKVQVVVYDKASTLQTLKENSPRTATFESFQNIIYKGTARIEKGGFEVTFITPKDIDYREGKGQMYFYAVNADSTADIAGSFDAFTVGGSEADFIVDATPPEVILEVDDSNVLTALISDESGINLSRTGIGHEILLTLNDTLQIIANNYYISSQDFRNGQLIFPFGTLPKGAYTVRLKVWDTYNNATEISLDFVVKDNRLNLQLVNLFPNPTSGELTINVKHSANTDSDLDFSIQLFDNSGKLVYEKEESCYFCDSSLQLTADVREKALANGTYFLRVRLKNLSSNTQSSTSNKVIFWK